MTTSIRAIIISIAVLMISLNLTSCHDSTETIINKKTELIPVSSLKHNYEQVYSIFPSLENLSLSDNLYINIPDVTDIQTFNTRIQIVQDYEKYEEEFKDIFAYFFPQKAMNDNALFYGGTNSQRKYGENGIISNYNLVKDYRSELLSGSEGQVWLIYDESGDNSRDNSVYMELGVMTGYGYAMFDDGQCDFSDYQIIGSYSPNSTNKYLIDGREISIRDAVIEFEEFVNQIPHLYNEKESVVETRVAEVDVYKNSDNQYAYLMLTTKSYDDILFDYIRDGVSHSEFEDYSFSMSNAIVTSDSGVNILNNYYRCQQIEGNPEKLNNIISLRCAAETISSSLSQNVNFEVQKIELVYCTKNILTSDGYIDIDGGYPTFVAPSWKLTLYNDNDALFYICYLDAKDGENFRYYTTPDNMELIS